MKALSIPEKIQSVTGVVSSSLFLTLVLMLAAVSAPTIAVASDDSLFNDKSAFCSRTSNAALKACQHEAKDDFWIAIGNCTNLPTMVERWECAVEAQQEKLSAKEECGEQYQARDEVCQVLGQAVYNPIIDPSNFMDKATIVANPNPYFPLIPGTTYVYHGADEIIRVIVTDETKEILGVTTIVVNDVVTGTDGKIIEDTDDWYAQDNNGNVWYFGEIAQEFEDGELASLDGSWKSGVDGAKPGILMQAMPQIGQLYRQEFFLGDAEDMGEVLSLTGMATVPATACSGTCLVTRDFTPLEPGAEENKYYAPGVGMILELNPETGERVELVEIIRN